MADYYSRFLECRRIKAETNAAIVMWQDSDFFEMYGEDAKIAAVILNIAMPQRSCNRNPKAGLLIGIPRHDLGNNARKLNEAGYTVAVSNSRADGSRSVFLYPAKPAITKIPYSAGDKISYFGKTHEIATIDNDFVRLRNLSIRPIDMTASELFGSKIEDYVSINRCNFERMLSDGDISILEKSIPAERFVVYQVPNRPGIYVVWDNKKRAFHVSENGSISTFANTAEAGAFRDSLYEALSHDGHSQGGSQ